MYDCGAGSSGITPVPNFTEIHPVVIEFNCADRRTQTDLHAFISFSLCKERITELNYNEQA
jgi:hypothetical protein